MSDHKTFCAFGAFAVNVTDPKLIFVKPLASAADLEPDPEQGKFDERKLVPLPLDQRLGEDLDVAILDTLGMEKDQHAVDDPEDPEDLDKVVVVEKTAAPAYPDDVGINVLTIGPFFPGQSVGGVYVERNKFYNEIRRGFDPDPKNRLWPHAKLRTYQVMSSASRGANGISRYHGFLATVKKDLGTIKVLMVEGRKDEGATELRVDMNNRIQCDDPDFLSNEIQDPDHPEPRQNVLDAQSKEGEQGAVFLSLTLCVEQGFRSPKEPPGGGGMPGDGSDPESLPVQATGSGSSGSRLANTSNLTFVNIGAPGIDPFTGSVFERSLKHANARKFVIKPIDLELEALRSKLMELARNVNGKDNILDIIADAPAGIQKIGKSTVLATKGGAQSISEILDADLVRDLRKSFTRCRLLGCATALDPEVRKRMLELDQRLGMPVIGTLRAIAFPDFGNTSFHDRQKIRGKVMSIVISTRQMNGSGEHRQPKTEADIANGIIQQEWLSTYDQVKVEPEDLEGDVPGDAKPWPMPDDLLSSHLAATDQIQTAAMGVVALQTPSGAVRCEVLVSATLLRLKSKAHGWVYVNVPWNSNHRRTLRSLIPE